MTRLKMHSLNIIDANIDRIAELFPSCVTEAKDDTGTVTRSIDFDQLRQQLSDHIVDGPRERFHLDWPGKREALLLANAPVVKTLRPCREESVDFDKTNNLFIEGDNLDALKLLRETYLNKVKLIYIDPPYNTGNDFVYNDDYCEDANAYITRSQQQDDAGTRMVLNPESFGRFHSAWLSMMCPRLRVAHQLLKDEGLIFVSIDSGEAANLRLLMDEVFGSSNFVGLLPTVMNLKGNNDAFAFSDTHEFTLVYAKNRQRCTVNQLPIDEEALDKWDADERGPFKRADTLKRTGQDAAREKRPNGWFPVFITPEGRVYATPNDKPTSPKDIELWPVNDQKDELSWTWSKKKINDESYNLIVVDGNSGKNIYKKQRPALGDLPSSKPKSILYRPEYSSSNGTAEVGELLGNRVFDSPPKPRALIRDFVILGSDKDSLIVDFFAGSGTTAHAVMAQNLADGGNRKFIMVQIPAECPPDSAAIKAGYANIAEITKERIRRSGKTLKEEASLIAGHLDIGFRVLKVDTSNMKDVYYQPDAVTQATLLGLVDNIKEDRIDEDLLFQVLLDWGVDLTLPIKSGTINDKTVYFVDTDALAACFETGIDEAFIKELAKRKPLRAVFRDTGYGSDATKINVEQIFKVLSPGTEVKSI